MIKPRTIDAPTYFVIDPNGMDYELNEYEILDLRIQIMNREEEGWYVIFGEERIDINKSGKLSNYPKGFFDSMENYYHRLLGYTK